MKTGVETCESCSQNYEDFRERELSEKTRNLNFKYLKERNRNQASKMGIPLSHVGD